MKRYFGCSGYYYGGWKGIFYPDDLKENKWLEYYSRKFNSVEINSSFYRFPFPNVVKGWYNKTPDNFKFALKGNRNITHVRKLKNVRRLIKSFYRLSDLLKEKLGCVLWQLPPNLKMDLKRLDSFCKELDLGYNNVIEFRHESWYCKEVYRLLKDNKIGFYIVSAPKLPESVKVTSSVAYIRFHGKKGWYRYNYSRDELKKWAERIKKIRAKELYCFFNNDYNANAVKNCLVLKRLVN
jgi:uncharacterized protein YecE (DUF72 family)